MDDKNIIPDDPIPIRRSSVLSDQLEKVVEQTMGMREQILKFDISNISRVNRKEMGNDTSVLLYRFVRLLGLKDVLGGGFSTFSYYAGKRIGARLNISSIEEMTQWMETLKLGRIEVLKFDKKCLLVNLYESATCAGILPIGQTICYFEAGIFCGIAESILKIRMVVEETKCWGKGDKYCQFHATELLKKTDQDNEASNKQDTKKPHSLNNFIEDMSLDYSSENLQLLSTLAAHTMVALENAFLYEQAKKLMIIDTLTNVYNFGYFQSRVKEEFGRAERHNMPLSVMLIDVDYFKKYNDTFGHPEGDALLIELCKIVKKNIRTIDILCRYGGDEFAVILPHIDETQILPLAKRIVDKVGTHTFIRADEKRKITVSLGISTFPKNADNMTGLIKKADEALYQAKNDGRNCFSIYSEKGGNGK